MCVCGGGSRVQPYLSVWDNYNYTGSAISKQICRFAPHVLTRCVQGVAYPNRTKPVLRTVLAPQAQGDFTKHLQYWVVLQLFVVSVFDFDPMEFPVSTRSRDVTIALIIKAYVETSPFSLMLYALLTFTAPLRIQCHQFLWKLLPTGELHTHTQPGHKSFKHSLF